METIGKQRIVFRADGNEVIGLGHIMRCLALAEMLADAFECEFVVASPNDLIRREIEDSGFRIQEVPPVAYELTDARPEGAEIPFDLDGILKGDEVVVLDGYWFGATYQEHVLKRGALLVNIDDAIGIPCLGSLVINHSLAANWSAYQPEMNEVAIQKVKCGENYVLVRKLFFKPTYPTKKQYSLLIILGGSRQEGIIAQVCAAVESGQPRLDNIAVVSSSMPEREHPGVDFFCNLPPKVLSGLYASSDWVIAPASTAAFEVLATGSKLVTGYLAENQKPNYEAFESRGVRGIGDFRSITNWSEILGDIVLNRTEDISRKNWFTYAGKRFTALFRFLYQFGSMPYAKKVAKADARQLYLWKNDPETRKNSINTEMVSWEDHLSWLDKTLANQDVLLFMVIVGQKNAGTFRLDLVNNEYVINFTVAPEHRGKGLGFLIIDLIESLLRAGFFGIEKSRALKALVRPSNLPSQRIFEKAGFERLAEMETVLGASFFQYSKKTW